jgi:pilus assembly protein CpaF
MAVAAAIRELAPTVGSATAIEVANVLNAPVGNAGLLEPLLHDPAVTDVLVNGPGPVWVDRGHGLRRTSVTVSDEYDLRRLAVRLVAAGGRRLDDAAPYADARLADGTRIHAVLPPLSPQGTCLSLRIPPRRTFTITELVELGSLPADGAELMRRLVGARRAFLVTGGTGSGKTTVLSTLLSLADDAERLVLVEDAAELRPDHPHVVRLEARSANAEGVGAVSLETLVRQALRMRPDRLIVGEVRGDEVMDLLSALNTGHAGGCGTVHANRAEHLPARIEALCARAHVSRSAAHSLLAAAVDVVVHVTRDAAGRRIAGLGVLRSGPDGEAHVVPAYTFGPDAATRCSGADDLDDRLSDQR